MSIKSSYPMVYFVFVLFIPVLVAVAAYSLIFSVALKSVSYSFLFFIFGLQGIYNISILSDCSREKESGKDSGEIGVKELYN